MKWLRHLIWELVVTRLRVYGLSNLRVYDAVVDVNGWGDFFQVDDAIDAGAKSILVRDGTYSGFTLDVSDATIVGESWATIIDGGTTSHAINVTGDRNLITNLQAKTTAGGGQAHDGIYCASSADQTRIIECYISQSDNDGIACYAETLVSRCLISACDSDGISIHEKRGRFEGNYITGSGAYAITTDGGADNSLITGNVTNTSGAGNSILINANAENCLINANLVDTAVSDLSGTSTNTDNQLY